MSAARAVETARTGRVLTSRRHKQERFALLARELGAEQARGDQFRMHTINPQCAARDASTRATLARAEADELRNLPVVDAARRIRPGLQNRSRYGSAQPSGSGNLTRSSEAHAATILAATGQRAACNAVHSHSPALVPRSATEGRPGRANVT